jgi:hypothetical protein
MPTLNRSFSEQPDTPLLKRDKAGRTKNPLSWDPVVMLAQWRRAAVRVDLLTPVKTLTDWGKVIKFFMAHAIERSDDQGVAPSSLLTTQMKIGVLVMIFYRVTCSYLAGILYRSL